MNRFSVEFAVGLFVIAGIASFSYLAVRLGDLKMFDESSYNITARFRSTAGLKEGAVVQVAGVKIGTVSSITLDPKEYEALVHLLIDKQVQLQEDSIASVRSSGIIGDKYISIAPGGADAYLQAGDEITDTESSVSLEELIGKYIFEKK